jgi:hypothetical protein
MFPATFRFTLDSAEHSGIVVLGRSAVSPLSAPARKSQPAALNA